MISGKTQYYNSLKAQQSLPSEMLVSQNPGETNVKTALIRPLPKIEPEVLKNFNENKQFSKENGFVCQVREEKVNGGPRSLSRTRHGTGDNFESPQLILGQCSRHNGPR